MKKVLLASAAVMALSATAAQAQDKYGRTFPAQQSSSATTTTTTTATPEPVYSNTTSTETSWAGGPYIGVYGGYGWDNAETAAGDLDIDGADYGALIGYKVNNLMNNSMGISGAVEAYIGDSSANDSVAGTSVDKDMEWGVNFRPGIQLSNGINPYAILGYRRTKFDTSTSGDESLNGFDAGVGAELMSWNNVGLRADYTHTWYNDKNGFDPDEDDLRLALTYHFQ